MNKHHSLDEAFRQKLRDLDAGAPMHLWEQISQKRDWKHRVLNQARQKKPLASLLAALVVVGLSWVVWPYHQQPVLESFPIFPSAPTASNDNFASEELPAIASNAGAKKTNAGAQPPATPPLLPTATAVAVAHSAEKQAGQLTAATPLSLDEAAAPWRETTAANPSSPPVRPVREEALPALPTTPVKGASILGRLFSPDPKCATFGNGSWSFYLDALVSPDLTFRQLQPRDPEFEEYVNTRKETESNMYAFSGALRLSMVSDNGLAFRTGINYSQINERFSYINGSEEVIETINNYDQEGNIISTDTIIKIGTRRKITQNYFRMLDIPFLLGYELTSNKLRISVNGGAYLNLLFRQKGDFLSPDNLQPVRFDSGDPDAFPAFKQQAGLGWYGSVGFAYQAGPNLQLVVEPHFKVFPKSITRDQYGVQQRYTTTGLFIGLRQQL